MNMNSGLTEHQLIQLRKLELDTQYKTKEEVVEGLLYVSRLLLHEQNLTQSRTEFNDRKIMNGYKERDKKLVAIAKIIAEAQGVDMYMPDNFIMDSKNPIIVKALKSADKILKLGV